MKVLICGDRKWGAVEREGPLIHRPSYNYAKLLYKAMKVLGPDDEVIEGEAAGADTVARIICELRDIPCTSIPADWCSFNTICVKSHVHLKMMAGTARNKEMAALGPDEVWAFHDDLSKSRGTMSMVRIAWANSIPVKLFNPAHPNGVLIDRETPLGLVAYTGK